MASEDGTYSTAEKRAYSAGPCPECGGRTFTEWLNVTAEGDVGVRWLPDGTWCVTPGRHKG